MRTDNSSVSQSNIEFDDLKTDKEADPDNLTKADKQDEELIEESGGS